MGKKKDKDNNYWDEEYEKDLESVLQGQNGEAPSDVGKSDQNKVASKASASKESNTETIAGKKEKKGKKKNGGDYWDEEFEKDLELAHADSIPAESPSSTPGSGTSNAKNQGGKTHQPTVSQVKSQMENLSLKGKNDAATAAKKKEGAPQKKETSQKESHASNQTKRASATTTDVVEEDTSKGVPKGRAAAVAAIRMALEAKKAEEEKLRAEEELASKKEEELRQKEEEEERRKEEDKLRKKEKEKQKKEALKREGKLLSKGEKERRARNAEYLEALKAQGFKIPNADDSSQVDGDQKAKKVEKAKKQTVDAETGIKKEDKVDKDGALVSEEEDHWEKLLEDSDNEAEADANEDSLSVNKESGAVSTQVQSKSKDLPVITEPEAQSQEQKQQVSLPKEAQSTKLSSTESDTAANKDKGKGDLRSPICCVLGHVDTGKTKLLDKMRQTNVQEGEAGGITQQIGATYFPADALMEKIEAVNRDHEFSLKVPGLLIIDTPGHESFTNLRSRGSSLCNLAVLVVDIMHGLEPQTLESIQLLRQRKTPFVVALNKIDRLYNWKTIPGVGFMETFEQQPVNVKNEFDKRYRQIMLQFAEQGLNVELFYCNKDIRRTVSVVPTSAHTGEGIPDLIMLILQLTQNLMSNQLIYLSELQCTVLEVKVIPGLGTTIDVVLSNGILNEGDRIVVCGLGAPIVSTIRALLTPQPMKELRIKSDYVHHKQVKASLGVKIVAQDLEKAVAGSRLLVAGPNDDIEFLKSEVIKDFTDLFEKIDKSGKGVYVQSSTIGSLEALLEFLSQMKVPVSDIAIGPVFKKDVMRASIMLEHSPEYAVILAFDVKIEKEAEEMAKDCGVLIFRADIIYHLFDMFTKHVEEIRARKRAELKSEAVFPCILKIIPTYIFNRSDPIVMGVDVKDGILKLGTPLCIPSKEGLFLGRVTSIEANHKPVESAKKGQSVAIKIESNDPKMYGRHFDHNDDLYSLISRQSIDILKEHFRDEMGKDEWILVIKMKPIFKIV